MPDPAPLLVFADDWGRHPSSCQHLIAHVLPHRRVVWVNTIGTRPPRLNWSTAKRGFEKLRQWTGSGRTATVRERVGLTDHPLPHGRGSPDAPHVISPKMWPSFRSRFTRGLNRRLLTRAIQPVVDALPRPPVVVTTLPLVADLVGAFPAARWVYYCVDDFGVWPGLDGRTLRDMEAELVGKVDEVIAVSETLQQHVAKLGKPSHLLTHGVDLDHWHPTQAAVTPAWASELDQINGAKVVFWGVIDRRMDIAFVRKLSDSLAREGISAPTDTLPPRQFLTSPLVGEVGERSETGGGNSHTSPPTRPPAAGDLPHKGGGKDSERPGVILLVGPQDNPDPELLRLPRVRTLPPIPYDELPELAARAAVLVMPYADLPVTRAMQPLKLKEYLATGNAVVVRKLPSTEPWADCLDVADTPEAFAGAVLERLRAGVPESQRAARTRLAAEGWDAKAALFEKWVDGG